MKVIGPFLILSNLLVGAAPAGAAEIEGPGRFCGYAAIIDLHKGESIKPISGGIHSGRFRWKTDSWTLEIRDIGWASKPKGSPQSDLTKTGLTLFSAKRESEKFVLAIWNHRNGAAYISSESNFSEQQMAAINRVHLFDELSEKPEHCNLKTVFVGFTSP